MTDENENDSDDESIIENEKDEKSVNMFMVPNGITMSSMSMDMKASCDCSYLKDQLQNQLTMM